MVLPPCPPLSSSNTPCSKNSLTINELDLSTNINASPNQCTFCTGDTNNNIWFIPGAPGYGGQCRIDQMTFEQVFLVLQRVPQAKNDLLRITSDPVLIELANEVKPVDDEIEADVKAAHMINKGAQARLGATTARELDQSLLFYNVLKGNTGGDIK